jgi:hypothetical protein
MKGRRFKTKKYTDYSKTLLMILPKVSVPNTQLEINFIFAFHHVQI